MLKNGIIYKGPSQLDGTPIVAIGVWSGSNKKTGKVLQTYILVDGSNPLEASKTGSDYAICGDCTMRGEVTTDPARKIAKNRRCYVNLGQGVLIVYKSYIKGNYKPANPIELGRGRFVRSGPMATHPQCPTPYGTRCYPRRKLGRPTHTKNLGDQISPCNPPTLFKRRSPIGRRVVARFELYRTLNLLTPKMKHCAPHPKKPDDGFNVQLASYARDLLRPSLLLS